MKLGKYKLDKIYHGDCKKEMKYIPSNSIDLILTDPPYGYSFMGKDWDTFKPQGAYQYKKGFKQLPRHSPDAMIEFFVPIWKECLRILKSGSFVFVMCAPRQDVLIKQIQALSEAGFNTGFTSIYWTYASGFPKASNIGKIVDKRLGAERKIINIREKDRRPNIKIMQNKPEAPFKLGLKPEGTGIDTAPATPQAKALNGSYGGFQPKLAVEVIIVAMKPLSEKSYVDQALKNKKGITWLEDGRIPYESEEDKKSTIPFGDISKNKLYGRSSYLESKTINKFVEPPAKGRFPANLLVSDDVLNDGIFRQPAGNKGISNRNSGFGCPQKFNPSQYNDGQSFSRYFDLDKWSVAKGVKDTFPFLIVPKASKSEKNRGCEKLPIRQTTGGGGMGKNSPDLAKVATAYGSIKAKGHNIHPTVKPIKLMSYLITLGSRKGDIILDPFIGSGTTAIACKQLNRRYLGFETNKEYIEIANARLKAVKHVQEKLL